MSSDADAFPRRSGPQLRLSTRGLRPLLRLRTGEEFRPYQSSFMALWAEPRWAQAWSLFSAAK
jgi:hypothetical protein